MTLLISFNTGMRRGEVCGLEWDAVDFSEGAIMVKQQMIQYPQGKWKIATPKTKKAIVQLRLAAS